MNRARENAKKLLVHCFDYMSGFLLRNDHIKADMERVVDLIIEAAVEEINQREARDNECLRHIQNPFPSSKLP